MIPWGFVGNLAVCAAFSLCVAGFSYHLAAGFERHWRRGQVRPDHPVVRPIDRHR